MFFRRGVGRSVAHLGHSRRSAQRDGINEERYEEVEERTAREGWSALRWGGVVEVIVSREMCLYSDKTLASH